MKQKTLPTGTHLIQRLNKPLGSPNPFSFGGGYAHGGLNKNAAELLSKIWDFDYMGSAEFEWGAVPAALEKIKAYSIANRASTGIVAELGDAYQPPKKVYYVCEKGLEESVQQVITQLAENEREFHLKEFCGLRESLEGKEYFNRIGGWLELDNGFMFFDDEQMYRNTLEMFGINAQSPTGSGLSDRVKKFLEKVL